MSDLNPNSQDYVYKNVRLDKPHFMVRCMNRSGLRVIFAPFHETEAEAVIEAERMAQECPGKRFAVYKSGPSFKCRIEE